MISTFEAIAANKNQVVGDGVLDVPWQHQGDSIKNQVVRDGVLDVPWQHQSDSIKNQVVGDGVLDVPWQHQKPNPTKIFFTLQK